MFLHISGFGSCLHHSLLHDFSLPSTVCTQVLSEGHVSWDTLWKFPKSSLFGIDEWNTISCLGEDQCICAVWWQHCGSPFSWALPVLITAFTKGPLLSTGILQLSALFGSQQWVSGPLPACIHFPRKKQHWGKLGGAPASCNRLSASFSSGRQQPFLILTSSHFFPPLL